MKLLVTFGDLGNSPKRFFSHHVKLKAERQSVLKTNKYIKMLGFFPLASSLFKNCTNLINLI